MATRSVKGQSSTDTQRAVLDLIRSSDAVSRTELAALSGLAEATISKVVKSLLDEDLVVEVGFADSTGGKRPVLLSLNTTANYAIGVQLDARSTLYVITDMSGRPVHHGSADGYGTTPPALMIRRIAADIQRLIRKAKIQPSSVLGIGVATAGRVDASGGVLRNSRDAHAWEDFDLEAALSEATALPVILENDAKSAALGEFWASRLPSTRDFAMIYMSAGIGCGIVINGALYRGASGNAGEIGHITIDANGPACFCGRRGCLEPAASPAAIVAFARTDAELTSSLGLNTGDTSEETVREDYLRIAHAAAAGDERCVALIRSSAELIAVAITSIVNLLDLNAVYLGGPAFAEAGPLYLEVVQATLDAGAFMRDVHPIDVRLSAVGDEASALGAASVVLHSQLTPYR